MQSQTHLRCTLVTLATIAALALSAGMAHAQQEGAKELRQLKGYAEYLSGDYKSAHRDFLQAAEAGIRAAQYNVAVMLLRGEVQAERSDYADAIDWMRKSADAQFPEAEFALGKLYETGDLLPRDLSLALTWYEKAANQEHVDAQLETMTAYMMGRGTAQDAKRAAQWAERAAVAGDEGAQYLLATFYEKGDGVERDLQRALQWYSQAARSGDVAAAAKARELARVMRQLQ
jgi:uncharacterized protein